MSINCPHLQTQEHWDLVESIYRYIYNVSWEVINFILLHTHIHSQPTIHSPKSVFFTIKIKYTNKPRITEKDLYHHQPASSHPEEVKKTLSKVKKNSFFIFCEKKFNNVKNFTYFFRMHTMEKKNVNTYVWVRSILNGHSRHKYWQFY